MTTNPASQALIRYKVLDLTRARAGPTAARQLADWGASVIKIEAPGQNMYADFSTRHSPDFQNLHRNKRAMTLDLKSDAGKKIFMKLAAESDVIVENYRPDVKHRLGIDYEAVKAVNPKIVYASISGFGQDGPYVARPGLDPIIQGMGGHMMVTGEPGRGPMRSGAAISDMTAGLLAANGILTALLEREASGEGQWVQTSLLEAQIFLLDFQAARYTMNKEVPGQAGNNHPTNVPTGVFKSRDGYVTMAPMTSMLDKFWMALGAPDLCARPEYDTIEKRRENREAMNADIEVYSATKDTLEWVDIMNEVGVPCGPIYTLDQTFNDPQVQHLGIAQTVESAKLGPTTLVGQPLHLSRTPNQMISAAPEVGEHTDEVLAEMGYSTDEIAAFRDQAVV
jgi:crotonobetainyl-CoA:carnitine CoA-transferase CaiB-like acyl-CoA transferase